MKKDALKFLVLYIALIVGLIIAFVWVRNF